MKQQYSSYNPKIMQEGMKYLSEGTGIRGSLSKIYALGRIISGVSKAASGKPSNISMNDFKRFFGDYFDSVPKGIYSKIEMIVSAANDGRLKTEIGRNDIIYIRDGMNNHFAKDNIQCESEGDHEGRAANAFTEVFIKGAIGIAAEQVNDIPLTVRESAIANQCLGEGRTFKKIPSFIEEANSKAGSARAKHSNDIRHAVTDYVKNIAISEYVEKCKENPGMSPMSYGNNNYKRLDRVFSAAYEEKFGRPPAKDRISPERVANWIRAYKKEQKVQLQN